MAFDKVEEETDISFCAKKACIENKKQVKNAVIRTKRKLADSTCVSILTGKRFLLVSKDGCPC